MRSTDTKKKLKEAPAKKRDPKPRDIDFEAVDAMVTGVLEHKAKTADASDLPSYQFSEDELVEVGDLRVRRVPDDRIVMPQDLLNLQEDLGYTIHQICRLVGIHVQTRWYAIKNHPDVPLDPAIAKLVIWYSQHPERAAMYNFSMRKLAEHPMINFGAESLGALFGRTKIAAAKWLREGAKQEPYVLAMAEELTKLLEDADKARARVLGGDVSRRAALERAKASRRLESFLQMALDYQADFGKKIISMRRKKKPATPAEDDAE